MIVLAGLRSPRRPLPRGPVLGWRSWAGTAAAGVPALDDLPYLLPTTSGRAALVHALRALQRPPGSAVHLPSYHCPSMAAAVVHAGLKPVFYPLDDKLEPEWSGLNRSAVPATSADDQGGVLLVVHYFGQTRSLAVERRWCDERGWALIEDCAHSWFGQAGERAVGQWGDYAIGSATKFFAVREGGLLASTRLSGESRPHSLPPAGWPAQVRNVLGQLAHAHRHGRMAGLSTLPGWLERLLTRRSNTDAARQQAGASGSPPTTEPAYDMSRCHQAAWASTEWLRRHLPRGRIVRRRQRAWQQLAAHVASLPGVQVWNGSSQLPPVAPYVLPLWVEREPDALYQHLRAAGVPVFRWDERWPGVEAVGDDDGARAARHLLQLPCHPDYSESELRFICQALTLAAKVPAQTSARAEST